MSVRLARPEDAAGILGIYAPIVRDTIISFELQPPSREEIAERIRSGSVSHPWIVDEFDGAVVGYAYASAHRARAAYAWAAEVSAYVAPSHQRQGAASRLYGMLFALLEDLGFHRALAGITLPNPVSVGFHESMGFRRIATYSEIGHKFGRWHDVGWWERQLSGEAEDGPPRGASDRRGSDAWKRILEDPR
jgi:phosphinothricin acetyltransferase